MCCFTKTGINKCAYISESSPYQSDYPWFLKCALSLNLEKPIPIISADVWSIKQCLFKEVQQFYLSLKSPKTPQYCIVQVFVYVNQFIPTWTRTGLSFQYSLYILKLLIIMFISMFDIQYWKCSSICNTLKIRKKVKILDSLKCISRSF